MEAKRGEVVQRQFGARMRELRQGAGLSQEAFAARCGLDRTYIGSVERGERNISLLNIHSIASALGIPVGELFHE